MQKSISNYHRRKLFVVTNSIIIYFTILRRYINVQQKS